MTADDPPAAGLLPLSAYDHVIVSYSGGKDSLACLLDLIDRGVPRERLELWHQDIDGHGEPLMDWPCTPAYVRATGEAVGVPTVFAWRDGGFVREMMRDSEPTAPVTYERDGRRITLPVKRATAGTRMQFPQVSADLSVRWCSAYLKIDVAARVLNNDARYHGKRVLFVTGERRQESTARAKYKEVEAHRTSSGRKRVDQWRSVIDWTEADVWKCIERHRVRPHPAYLLGWGRTSCLACIFGDADQWASVREVSPDRFNRIADLEKRFGKTIHRTLTVTERADRGAEFVTAQPDQLRQLAMTPDGFTAGHFYLKPGESWAAPPGAYKRCGGPT